jgi:NAD(P)-dependent dehydrogenase (short-subunit alcohol dehydrogenase family)
MKVFVTGVAGQLGHDVMNELARRGYEGIGTDLKAEYSGVQDGSPVTKAPYVSLDITDQEDASSNSLSKSERTEIIQAFVDTVNTAGYLAGVYSYYYWLKDKVYLSSIRNAYIWVAHYSATDLPLPNASMWQYSSKGSIPGINGNVDLDRSYF